MKSGEYASLALSANFLVMGLCVQDLTMAGKPPTYTWDLCAFYRACARDCNLISGHHCILVFAAEHDKAGDPFARSKAVVTEASSD